jgi:hypothetical protein
MFQRNMLLPSSEAKFIVWEYSLMYSIYSASRRMRWAEHVACMGEKRKVYRIFGGKAGRKETIRKTKA